MYLTKVGVTKENAPYIDFEKVASDLLMISVESSSSHNGLSYWRLTGMKDMPPLEMGVDYENGDLANITFFADPSCIKDEKVLHTDCYQGNLIISTNIFQKVNDYVDINETYEVYIQDKKCVCMFKTMEKLAKIYRNGRLEVYLNNQNMVIGIGISNLSDTELQLFRDV